MRFKSKEMEQELRTRGHPNHFQSQPRVTTHEWDMLQTLDPRTLLYTQVRTGNNGIWSGAVADITREIESVPQLLHNLRTVQRNVAPTTHATCLLMPSQGFFKIVMRDMVDATDAEVHAHMKEAARNFQQYVVDGDFQTMPAMADQEAQDWDLDGALGCLDSFYVLEALPAGWDVTGGTGPFKLLFKCSCPDFFKNAICHHALLASMVCDPKIRMPIRYHGVTVQNRRRRGRPSGKGSEYGDVGEAKARARIALQEGYKPPKVRSGHAIYFCLFAVKFRFYYAGYIPSGRSGFGRRRPRPPPPRSACTGR